MSYYIASCGHPVPIKCRACDRAVPGVTDSQLAVLCRQLQWTLDDAAYDFPGGQVTPGGREELAGTLESLAAVVRASVPSTETPAGRRLSPAPDDRPDSTPDHDRGHSGDHTGGRSGHGPPKTGR